MSEGTVPVRLAALGQATRYSMCARIAAAGAAGTTPGALSQAEGIPPNLVSHHLRPMTAAGLLTTEKVGREVIYRVAPGALTDLAGALFDLASLSVRPGPPA